MSVQKCTVFRGPASAVKPRDCNVTCREPYATWLSESEISRSFWRSPKLGSRGSILSYNIRMFGSMWKQTFSTWEVCHRIVVPKPLVCLFWNEVPKLYSTDFLVWSSANLLYFCLNEKCSSVRFSSARYFSNICWEVNWIDPRWVTSWWGVVTRTTSEWRPRSRRRRGKTGWKVEKGKMWKNT